MALTEKAVLTRPMREHFTRMPLSPIYYILLLVRGVKMRLFGKATDEVVEE